MIRRHFFLILTLALSLTLNLVSMRADHNWGGDYTWYLAQAQSLVDGTTGDVVKTSKFRLAHSTGYIAGPQIYPWGYPMLLAPIYALAGLNLLAFKALGVLSIVAACVALYLLFQKRGQAFWVVAVIAFSPWLFEFKNTINSDLPFFALTMFALLLIQRIVVDDRPIYSPIISDIILAVGIFLPYWVRTHGLVLIPTLLAAQLWRGLRLSDLIPYAIFAAGCLLNGFLPGTSSYVETGHFAYQNLWAILQLIESNTIHYSAGISEFIQTTWPLKSLLPLTALLFLFSGIGIIKRWREDHLYILFTAFYMGVLVIFPYRQFRFLICAIPFLIYFACQGARYIRLQPYFGGAISLISLATSIFLFVNAWRHNEVTEGPYTLAAQEAFTYIRDKTPKDAIFVFWKPRVLTFYTSRRAYFRYTGGALNGADYALVYDGSSDIARERNAILRDALNHKQPIWQNSKFSVYRTSDKLELSK